VVDQNYNMLREIGLKGAESPQFSVVPVDQTGVYFLVVCSVFGLLSVQMFISCCFLLSIGGRGAKSIAEPFGLVFRWAPNFPFFWVAFVFSICL